MWTAIDLPLYSLQRWRVNCAFNDAITAHWIHLELCYWPGVTSGGGARSSPSCTCRCSLPSMAVSFAAVSSRLRVSLSENVFLQPSWPGFGFVVMPRFMLALLLFLYVFGQKLLTKSDQAGEGQSNAANNKLDGHITHPSWRNPLTNLNFIVQTLH